MFKKKKKKRPQNDMLVHRAAFSIPTPQDAALRDSCSIFANSKDIFKSQKNEIQKLIYNTLKILALPLQKTPK